MIKKIVIFLLLLVVFIFPVKSLAIEGPTFVTLTNPVRGMEGWKSLTQKPLDIPIKLYQESSNSGLPSTWLLRFDAVEDATISAFFAYLIGPDKDVSLGGLLEITPNLTQKINLHYPSGDTDRNFLSGYTQDQRYLLIDAFMSSFKSRFGFYPRTVGAWHLDSYSLNYLVKKYSVQTAMILDEQYAVENITLSGGYLGSPYFPDKNNSLIPAESFKNRVNIPIVRYAQRDLFNFLNPLELSFYSIEPNDHQSLGLGAEYFEKLLEQYTQKGLNKFTYLNIGLENDLIAGDYLPEIHEIYSKLLLSEEKYRLRFTSLEYFGDWMKSMYPESSPVYFYRASDPTGKTTDEVLYYQTPFLRLILKSTGASSQIQDFRVYNRQIFEDYFATPNQTSGVFSEVQGEIDYFKNQNSSVNLDFDLTKSTTVYDEQSDIWNIAIQKDDQKILFTPRSITFSNIEVPQIASSNINVTKTQQDTVWKASPRTLFTNLFSNTFYPFLLVLLILGYCFSINKTFGIGAVISLIPLITVLKDSRLNPFGMGFWGSNAHDAIFHLSVIEKIAQNPFSLAHPQLSGEKLQNYHFVFDYLSAFLVRLTDLPATQIYFFFMPLIITIFLTFFIIKLLRVWKFKDLEIIISLIFAYLGGSFGFIPSIISGNSLFGGESAFWANQSISIFLNPPFALSLLVLILAMLVLEKYKENKSTKNLFAFIFLGGLLAQTKVYAFILLCSGLLFTSQWLLLVLVGILGVLFTLPFSSSAGFPFDFSPFWFIKSMFASSDRLNFYKAANAWQVYEATGSVIKLLILNILGIIIFYVGNIGTRLVGFYQILKGKNSYLSARILIVMAFVGLAIPLLFTQKFNPWNSIQFTYYSLFVFGLFSGRGVVLIINKIKSKMGRVVFVVLLSIFTLLTTIGSISEHIGFFPSSRISYTELSALSFLKSLPAGIVLAPFTDNSGRRILTPKPQYAYTSTAYISALSSKVEYLSDTINLDITGYSYQERAQKIQRFYNTADSKWAKSFLLENEIKYVYETPLKRINLDPDKLSLTKIFESGEINIYQTN